MYVPADKESAELLQKNHNMKTVVPMDIALGIDNLPFKISVEMMLDITRRAINSHSYEELQNSYSRDWHINISDDQIRKVTNYIGKIIFDDDSARKEKAIKEFQEKTNRSKHTANNNKKSAVLYIEMDGAMFRISIQQ